MKYFKFVSAIFVLSIFVFWFSFASNTSNISEKNKQRADDLMYVLNAKWSKENPIKQISRYESIINSFTDVTYKNADQKEMIEYLLSLFKIRLNNLRKNVYTQTGLISNVDWNQVNAAWLSWHNETRDSVWLPPYKVNNALNYSALVWANNLATTNRKSSTHWRNKSDWYYSYDSIKARFNDLGIRFSTQSTAFSESNAYQYYSCKKADCTAEMIAALKKSYNFLVNEKKTHYPAIVSKNFDQIWFWVAVNWTNVRITTHYATGVN